MTPQPPLLGIGGVASPSLAEYRAYHAMFAMPGVVRRCNASFTGVVLFMPLSSVLGGTAAAAARTAEAAPGAPAPFEVVGLSVATYYLLVLLSLTGLSTLLGCTRVIEAREVDPIGGGGGGGGGGRGGGGGSGSSGGGGSSVHGGTGGSSGRVGVSEAGDDAAVLEWTRRILARRFARAGEAASHDRSAAAAAEVRLVRRFRFNFRLAGVSVSMQHLSSPGAPGEPPLLHLAEQYEVNWICFCAAQAVLWLAVAGASAALALFR